MAMNVDEQWPSRGSHDGREVRKKQLAMCKFTRESPSQIGLTLLLYPECAGSSTRPVLSDLPPRDAHHVAVRMFSSNRRGLRGTLPETSAAGFSNPTQIVLYRPALEVCRARAESVLSLFRAAACRAFGA